MRQGHKMHKELENELHQTVTMTQITTAEEMWALRFLNILFGLQELQLHGMAVLLANGETHSRESSLFLDLLASTSYLVSSTKLHTNMKRQRNNYPWMLS
jgi:hypothetical protein